jgi:hypothetical protein
VLEEAGGTAGSGTADGAAGADGSGSASTGNVDSARAGGGPGDGTQGAGGPVEPDPRTVAANGPGVEGCTDRDSMARQLCEIATKEEDPFVKGNLWREYEEYVKVLEDTRR